MEPKKLLTGLVSDDTIKKAFGKINSDPQLAVEGCHYIIAREDRHQDAVNLIRDHFIPDEPTARSVALTWNSELEEMYKGLVQKNMTLALVSDTTGEIVAVRVAHVAKAKPNEKVVFKSNNLNKIFDLFGRLEDLCNPFHHFNVEEAVGFITLGVHRDYRQKGIGTIIMRAAVELVKNLGLGPVVIKGEGTSSYSQRIYEKLNFSVLSEVVYEEYKENGEIVFKNMGIHKSARLYGKVV